MCVWGGRLLGYASKSVSKWNGGNVCVGGCFFKKAREACVIAMTLALALPCGYDNPPPLQPTAVAVATSRPC